MHFALLIGLWYSGGVVVVIIAKDFLAPPHTRGFFLFGRFALVCELRKLRLFHNLEIPTDGVPDYNVPGFQFMRTDVSGRNPKIDGPADLSKWDILYRDHTTIIQPLVVLKQQQYFQV